MRILAALALYTALGTLANVAAAQEADLAALRAGDMMKLTVHDAPLSASEVEFTTDDGPRTLADWKGKVVLVNFWATWCAPCRKEMPSLAALQEGFESQDFEVLTIATGRNLRPSMERFMEEIEVSSLPLHTDPRQALARSMGVLGLPVSVLLDRDGNEVARLQGDADWASESARAVIAALIER